MKDHSIFNLEKGGEEKMGNRKYLRSDKGFTLIELVIVMVVLAIMAGLAIPKFLDLRADAKKSAVNGALGGTRSAVANFHAKSIATNPDDATPYPTCCLATDELLNGAVVNGKFPDNPYSTDATKNDVSASTVAKGTVGCAAAPVAGADWCYNTSNGEFWAATNVAGEKDL